MYNKYETCSSCSKFTFHPYKTHWAYVLLFACQQRINMQFLITSSWSCRFVLRGGSCLFREIIVPYIYAWKCRNNNCRATWQYHNFELWNQTGVKFERLGIHPVSVSKQGLCDKDSGYKQVHSGLYSQPFWHFSSIFFIFFAGL